MYRSSPEALIRERTRLVELVRALESRWTATFWSDVAPELALDPRRDWLGDDVESEVDALTVRARAMERVESDAPAIVAAWTTAPTPRLDVRVDLGDLHAWRERPDVLGPEIAAVVRWIGGAKIGAWIERVGEALRADAGALPIDLGVEVRTNRTSHYLDLVLACGVPPGLGTLHVRPETLSDDLLRLVGLGDELTLGVDAFDSVFRIRGDAHAAHAVLDERARRGLSDLGVRGPIELSIGDGLAWLRTVTLEDFELAPDAMRAALGVLRSVADAPLRPLRAPPAA